MGIPHCYKKKAFLDQIHQCNSEIFHAIHIRADIVKHLHPSAKVEDKYIHLLLVPLDKSLTEGMMLTNASILESLDFLIKQPNGKYILGENVKKRTVFLYRDALTICLHSLLYDKI
jgi:hypothetical protein